MVKTILYFVFTFVIIYFTGMLLHWVIPPLFNIVQTPDTYLFLTLIFIIGNLVGFILATLWFFVFD